MTKPHYPTRKDTRLTSFYGFRRDPNTGKKNSHHDGIDLAPRKVGTINVPVYAVADGVVKNREFNSISGNRIYIQHTNDNYTTVYLHLASFNVKKGDKVKRGKKIGTMGTTGKSTGIHLHFGVSKNYPVVWGEKGTFINPLPYLNKPFSSVLIIDGWWGEKLTTALQVYFGVIVDGEIWGQHKPNQAPNAITGGVKFGIGGSPVIEKLQRLVGAFPDGQLGKDTVRKIQIYLGTHVDGVISSPSSMVKELQRRLNNNSL